MAVKAKKAIETGSDELKWPFGKNNYIVFAVAILVIIAGYFSLGSGSITLAPILLVIGYCVLIPVALIIKSGAEEQDSSPAESE